MTPEPTIMRAITVKSFCYYIYIEKKILKKLKDFNPDYWHTSGVVRWCRILEADCVLVKGPFSRRPSLESRPSS